MTRALFFTATAALLGLVSCATVSKVGRGSVDLVKKTTESTTSKVSSLSETAMNKIRPPGVKVVEVREKDLKELPTGHEKALAFENTKKRNSWASSSWSFFQGPVDFIEPDLPPATAGEEDLEILLPPKME